MIAIQENNKVAEASAPPAPLYNESTRQPYRYRMFYDGNRFIAHADTVQELLDLLIDGYLEMNEVERQEARIKYALSAQSAYQDRLYLSPEVREGLKEWEFNVATGRYGTNAAFIHGFGKEIDGEDYWNPAIPVPLVLIDTFYEPHSNVPRPFSFHQKDHPVYVICAGGSEEEFLVSLNQLGETTLVQTTAPSSVIDWSGSIA